ncbi:hypothetical protein FRX31_008426 [Thalictrum thalictroides]|uniref:DUF4283 domain-containing protein n=1 Tax=Thalictrum thalictroides TaxID=46969 RepID=A0A7J6X0Q2_THATH|nr:hypothetical protein FRX31_008426 [Thalictrum thalictroides]
MPTYKRVVSVDRKNFEVVWKRGNANRGCAEVTEKWKGRSFKACCSVEGGKWLGGLLLRLGEGVYFKRLPRFVNGGETIRATVKSNRNGWYIQLLFFEEGAKGGPSVICVPQGSYSNHWRIVGEMFNNLFVANMIGADLSLPVSVTTLANSSVHCKPPPVVCPVVEVVEEPPVIISAWPKQYMSWNSKKATVDILSKGASFGAAWWASVVVCSASVAFNCWEKVERCIQNKFGVKKIEQLSEQVGLVFLNSEDDAARLAFMPHLVVGAVDFTFTRWKPECGSLLQSFEREWNLNLMGFPLHLKTEDIVRTVAGVLGEVKMVDEKSIEKKSSKVEVIIQRKNIFDLPRCISLVENGIVFPIMVCLESPVSIWEEGGFCTFSGYSIEGGGDVSQVGTRVGEEVDPEEHSIALNYGDKMGRDDVAVVESEPGIVRGEIQMLNTVRSEELVDKVGQKKLLDGGVEVEREKESPISVGRASENEVGLGKVDDNGLFLVERVVFGEELCGPT